MCRSLLFFSPVFRAGARADIPVHCLEHQVVGTWTFHLGAETGDRWESCGHATPDVVKYTLRKGYRVGGKPVTIANCIALVFVFVFFVLRQLGVVLARR